MGPTITFLLFNGLCLEGVIRAQIDILPRPTLWVVPSPVVSKGANVTLRCQGHLGSDRFELWKDGNPQEQRKASWQLGEFVFRSVDDKRDAKSYSCRAGQGPLWSELSEPLALVVMTGTFPKPSISVSPNSTISSGTTVTLRCQMLAPLTTISFALLEAKSLKPLQLQSPAGKWADFSLPSVRVEDSGSYSCIFYRKTAPHVASHPSETLELIVTGPLPKPTLWAQPGLVVDPEANITLWCSRPKLFSLEEVIFTLWKTETQDPLQHQPSVDLWTNFLLPSVRPEHTGSYRCAYKDRKDSARESEPSDALELVVLGSLPKPSLSALPGLVVEPGTHVTFQCQLPPQSSLSRVTFTLLKVGTPQPLQSQSPAGTLADFPLLSVMAQDAGNYTCVYQKRMTPYGVSEPSEVLEIWVTDALPKLSLSAWPGPEVIPGANVTLLCWGPSSGTRFVLCKEGDEKNLLSMDIRQNGAQFFLTQVNPKHSGNYSCKYELSTKGSLWTKHSDALQLIVRGSVPRNNLIITLSCVSVCLFLLCLRLLAFLCRQSVTVGSLQEERSRRCLNCPIIPWSTFLPHYPEPPKEEIQCTEAVKERPRKPLLAMAEDPQEVTYTQLNLKALNKRKIDPKKTPEEPMLYATVSLN